MATRTTRGDMRPHLLATVAMGVALAVSTAGAALGQQPADPAAPALGESTGAAEEQLQAAKIQAAQILESAEAELRGVRRNIDGDATTRERALQQARQAVLHIQQAVQQLPEQQRATQGQLLLQQHLAAAQQVLAAEDVQPQQARSAIQNLLGVLPAARTELSGQPGGAPTQAQAEQGARPAQVPGQVVIEQPTATLQVTQPPPQVTVEQDEPVITVIIPQPEIIVRQPPPQITVRMPEPRVNVEQERPQVSIAETAQPQVQVAESQPRVQVQQVQPRVIVRQAEGQPQIRFEQQGEATIRHERQAQAPQRQAPQPEAAQQQAAQQQAAQQAEQQTAPAQARQPQAAPTGMPVEQASAFVGTHVVGAEGRNAGEIQNLLVDNQGMARAAVVEWGGFLGIDSRQAVVPIENIRLNGGRAEMNLTRAQLEQLPRYERARVAEVGQQRGWSGVRLYR